MELTDFDSSKTLQVARRLIPGGADAVEQMKLRAEQNAAEREQFKSDQALLRTGSQIDEAVEAGVFGKDAVGSQKKIDKALLKQQRMLEGGRISSAGKTIKGATDKVRNILGKSDQLGEVSERQIIKDALKKGKGSSIEESINSKAAAIDGTPKIDIDREMLRRQAANNSLMKQMSKLEDAEVSKVRKVNEFDTETKSVKKLEAEMERLAKKGVNEGGLKGADLDRYNKLKSEHAAVKRQGVVRQDAEVSAKSKLRNESEQYKKLSKQFEKNQKIIQDLETLKSSKASLKDIDAKMKGLDPKSSSYTDEFQKLSEQRRVADLSIKDSSSRVFSERSVDGEKLAEQVRRRFEKVSESKTFLNEEAKIQKLQQKMERVQAIKNAIDPKDFAARTKDGFAGLKTDQLKSFTKKMEELQVVKAKDSSTGKIGRFKAGMGLGQGFDAADLVKGIPDEFLVDGVDEMGRKTKVLSKSKFAKNIGNFVDGDLKPYQIDEMFKQYDLSMNKVKGISAAKKIKRFKSCKRWGW